jgi:uncharacterized protein (TIGR03437 family)
MSRTPWKRTAASWHPLVRLLLLTSFSGLRAEPIIFFRAVLNAASFMPPGVPGGSIARGSIFTIFGRDIGPAARATVSAFPLETTFQNVSIEIIQGSTTVNAIPIFVSAGQLNAIMPSDAPLGRVTLRVTFNGEQSNPETVTVVENSVGIFTATGSGIGPGIVQNLVSQTVQPINTTTRTAKPGQVATMWDTGLGPISAPDNTAPPVGTLPFEVAITVGGKTVTNVFYAGRAPCCAGVDQFVFEIPADAPHGCYVPLRVRVAGEAVSNTVTMAIESDQQRCSEPENPAIETFLSGDDRPGADAADGVRNRCRHHRPVAFTIDNAWAYFSRESGGELAFNPLFALPPHGACVAYAVAGDLVGGIPSPYVSSPGLDAGEITLNGPAGAAELERTVEGESTVYSNVTVGGPEGVSAGTDEPLFFSPGSYQIKGTGGAEVGPIDANAGVSPPRFSGRIAISSARWRAAKESLSNGRRGTPLGLPSRASASIRPATRRPCSCACPRTAFPASTCPPRFSPTSRQAARSSDTRGGS